MDSKERIGRGWQWGTSTLVAGLALALPLTAAASIEVAPAAGPLEVIVQEYPEAGNGPELAVARLGGQVTRQIPLIDGFVATIPNRSLAALRSNSGVRAVTEDSTIRLSDASTEPATTPSLSGDTGDAAAATTDAGVASTPAPEALADGDFEGPATTDTDDTVDDGALTDPMDGYDAVADPGSLYNTASVIGATRFWKAGHTGQGVDVAVLDSGVAPVKGLDEPDKLVYGPDLSFESQQDNLRYLDTFGHGTHMAGIIAARDAGAPASPGEGASTHLRGIAPGARIVSVKVADRTGAADVSQVIAGIDWIIQHRNTNGLNIRVLNLSFGTDGVQDYRLDPLSYAVEMAWKKGIVVVVSAGNTGYGSAKLNNPAYNPYIIAVGASDPKGTKRTDDDDVPSWSSSGDGARNPDLVAPGKSIVSLRVPGSGIDTLVPTGRVGSQRFFRGSGTSQAAAVVSGAAAVMLSQRPYLQPDQVKAMLVRNTSKLAKYEGKAQGNGVLRIGKLLKGRVPKLSRVTQTWEPSTGTGSIDAARGTKRLEHDGKVLDGERDIHGRNWDGRSWSSDLLNGRSWTGGDWRGVTWSGATWSGATWSGATWSGATWSGATWSGATWSGATWSGATWSGATWSGATWSGNGWQSATTET